MFKDDEMDTIVTRGTFLLEKGYKMEMRGRSVEFISENFKVGFLSEFQYVDMNINVIGKSKWHSMEWIMRIMFYVIKRYENRKEQIEFLLEFLQENYDVIMNNAFFNEYVEKMEYVSNYLSENFKDFRSLDIFMKENDLPQTWKEILSQKSGQ